MAVDKTMAGSGTKGSSRGDKEAMAGSMAGSAAGTRAKGRMARVVSAISEERLPRGPCA